MCLAGKYATRYSVDEKCRRDDYTLVVDITAILLLRRVRLGFVKCTTGETRERPFFLR